jgi:uncharacterized protein
MNNNITPKQQNRVIILIIYFGFLLLINFLAFGQLIPPNGSKGLWFYSGFASILLGNLLVTPLYIKPVDAISYSVLALISLYLVNDLKNWLQIEKIIFYSVIVFFIFIILSSFIAILLKDSQKQVALNISNTCKLISEQFGNQRIIFSIVILFALNFFHRNNTIEFIYITLAWLVTIVLKPDLFLYQTWKKINQIWSSDVSINSIGVVVAYQKPDIFLIHKTSPNNIKFGTIIIANDPFASPRLGITLDYIGRDEALLLRCIELKVPSQRMKVLNDYCKFLPPNNVGIINIDKIFLEDEPKEAFINDIADFVGIVAPETSLENIYFEVIQEKDLEEGKLVKVFIREKPVLYQIIDGLTKEEIIYKKNKFGFVRAKAKKIGVWDKQNKKFLSAKWLPSLNSPVYLQPISKYKPLLESVGHFPSTNYSVCLKSIDDLVSHNTAILGILGIGKTMLAIELIERMIAKGIKIICLDLTNQYAQELSDFYNAEIEKERMEKIREAGEIDKNEWKKNPKDGGSYPHLENIIFKDLSNFLDPRNNELVKIYNPSDIFATKQLYDPRNISILPGKWEAFASLWDVTPVEITKIITENTLLLSKCQMTDKARTCIVFEEAHSLIPEWGTVACEGDKAATNATARAILQGRKYGLGCLLITQRTANVTKTILNQCNTIFAMRTFDDTGKEFLSNYIGRDYASVLPTIPERHAVFFGKSSSCADPVLIRLNDQKEFREKFRKKYPPPDLNKIYKKEDDMQEESSSIKNFEKVNNNEDDIPF